VGGAAAAGQRGTHPLHTHTNTEAHTRSILKTKTKNGHFTTHIPTYTLTTNDRPILTQQHKNTHCNIPIPTHILPKTARGGLAPADYRARAAAALVPKGHGAEVRAEAGGVCLCVCLNGWMEVR